MSVRPNKPMMTSLPAIAFMVAGMGLLMVATLIWFMALCGLLAVVAVRMSLRGRVMRRVAP